MLRISYLLSIALAMMMFCQTFAQTTVEIPCTGAVNPNSGRVTSSTKSYGYLWHGVDQENRGWARFNIQSYIPANATITAAEVTFWVETSTGSAGNNYLKFFTGDPGSMSASAIWSAIGQSSAHQASNADLNPAGQKTRGINATGVTFLNNNKTQAVNLGFSRGSGFYGFRIYGSDGAAQGTANAARRPILRITYSVPDAVTLDGVTVSNNCWLTNGSNDYTITAKATGSSPTSIGGNTHGMMVLINYQGANAGNHGGYFSWNTTTALLSAQGFTQNQMACTGGGFIGMYAGYGNTAVTLISGSTSVTGNQRTVDFVVRPNSTYPHFTNNSISQYAQSASGSTAGWTENTNLFSSTQPLVLGTLTVNGNSASSLVEVCPGQPIQIVQSGFNNQGGNTYFYSDNTTGAGGWAVAPEWEIISNGEITAANQVASQTSVNNLTSFKYKINAAGIYIIHANSNYGNCSAGPGTNRYIKVEAPSPLTTISPASASICPGGSVTLSASGGSTGSNEVTVWQSQPCNIAYEQNWSDLSFGTGNTTVNSVNGYLNVTSTNNDPIIDMSGLGSFNPVTYRYINIRYRVTAGNAGSTEIFFYNTVHPGAVGGETGVGSLISDGSWHILSIDMHTDPDYLTGGNITGWRYDWATAPGVTMDLDFISLDQYPIIGEGSINVTPSATTTYYASKRTNCGTTSCISSTVNYNATPAQPTYTAGNITVGPVVTANGTSLLSDNSLTGSGGFSTGHEEYRGRLFNVGAGTRGWASNGANPSYWQADLGSIKPVNGVITQGRGDCCPQWVTEYEVRVSQNGTDWISMGIFPGNSDQHTPVTNMFGAQTTSARYVRIYPTNFNGHITMRADVISIPGACSSGAQAVSVAAEFPASADNIRWYAASSGGSPLATGQFYTASVSSTTPFYAASYNSATGCESTSRTLVSAQVGISVGSAPTTIASIPAVCTDFTSALPNGWKTDHQGLATPSASSTHDCSGLAASMNTAGHYVWARYNSAATHVKYTLKMNSGSVRNLLVEQSADGCNWTQVAIHTNATVASDLSIVEFTGSLNSLSRHVRFNMTRRDGGRIEVDNIMIYNTTPPLPAALSGTKTKTCKVYGQHWVNFYADDNTLIGSIKANGALDGSTNDLGEVTLAVNAGSPNTVFACNTTNPAYETAYMGRRWNISSSAFPNSANFSSQVSIRLPYNAGELSDMNTEALATTGNPNDNNANATNLMLTKISGGAVTNFDPSDNCGNATISGIAQSANGALATAYPSISASGSFIVFNVGQFSEMYLHKSFSTSPLPVQLISFSGNCNDQQGIELEWTTASEQNSDKFIVQRSRDMIQWDFISELAAAGNSNSSIQYFTTDTNPLAGIAYYRLLQLDFNGTEKIYGPISISCLEDKANNMLIFPNPSSGSFTVEISSMKELENAQLQLIDLTGKLISRQQVHLVAGVNHVLFEESHLKVGTYFVKILNEENTFQPVKVMIH